MEDAAKKKGETNEEKRKEEHTQICSNGQFYGSYWEEREEGGRGGCGVEKMKRRGRRHILGAGKGEELGATALV